MRGAIGKIATLLPATSARLMSSVEKPKVEEPPKEQVVEAPVVEPAAGGLAQARIHRSPRPHLALRMNAPPDAVVCPCSPRPCAPSLIVTPTAALPHLPLQRFIVTGEVAVSKIFPVSRLLRLVRQPAYQHTHTFCSKTPGPPSHRTPGERARHSI